MLNRSVQQSQEMEDPLLTNNHADLDLSNPCFIMTLDKLKPPDLTPPKVTKNDSMTFAFPNNVVTADSSLDTNSLDIPEVTTAPIEVVPRSPPPPSTHPWLKKLIYMCEDSTYIVAFVALMFIAIPFIFLIRFLLDP
ncbi:uncharacterized protein LOC121867729 [Homarus americanus]|uniref:uncharacterized protein LOC121867729 n=1 Tax=Homarus americanus TaxID=6706 RepID=UPI001C48FC44|nr:uncharacterized protein LOC121867729 [Homarus americanus]